MTKRSAKGLNWSLRFRLGLGAALMGAGALATALVLYTGLSIVASRLDTAVAAEKRMARYATLSTQVSTFLVIATEAIQTGLPQPDRVARLEPVAQNIEEAFRLLRTDLMAAVSAAEAAGIDQQSRLGTQSLGLARMEAQLERTIIGLGENNANQSRLRAHLDSFASGFDPLLNQAVNTEVVFRNDILTSIEALRRNLTRIAVAIAVLSILSVLLFYFGLIRPQFGRLDRLRDAARQIGDENFALALPAHQEDEIGQIYAETNRMAAALADRQRGVAAEWARLNDTIDKRTEELRTANRQLEEIDGNRRRFFADVSHELRTPLTVIMMEAQIGGLAEGGAATAFKTIEARANRLNRRIDDLLRVARSDTGQLALDLQKVALAPLLNDVRAEIRAEIENAGMALSVDPIPDVTLLCDQNWLRQIVVGLIR
ncbi:MAG: HAMP domain-containing sensor histidine kinase, partial [Pseudomonadota bacterium]